MVFPFIRCLVLSLWCVVLLLCTTVCHYVSCHNIVLSLYRVLRVTGQAVWHAVRVPMLVGQVGLTPMRVPLWPARQFCNCESADVWWGQGGCDASESAEVIKLAVWPVRVPRVATIGDRVTWIHITCSVHWLQHRILRVLLWDLTENGYVYGRLNGSTVPMYWRD